MMELFPSFHFHAKCMRIFDIYTFLFDHYVYIFRQINTVFRTISTPFSQRPPDSLETNSLKKLGRVPKKMELFNGFCHGGGGVSHAIKVFQLFLLKNHPESLLER